MAPNEPRPHRRRRNAPNPGILGTDAWNPQIERQCGSEHFAESGDDHVHTRKRHNREQIQTCGCGLRLLSDDPRTGTQLANRDAVTGTKRQFSVRRTKPESSVAKRPFQSLTPAVVPAAKQELQPQVVSAWTPSK